MKFCSGLLMEEISNLVHRHPDKFTVSAFILDVTIVFFPFLDSLLLCLGSDDI